MDLNDFGLGVSLYFVTIAFLSVLLFISSCVAIPSLVYFSSTSYSASQSTLSNPLLRGSAICTTTAWVACPSCDPSLFPDSRKDSAGLFLKNNCAVDNDDTFSIPIAYVDLANIFLLCIGILALNFLMKRKSVAFDEAKQTGSDYTVTVKDPDPDATSPDEWRDFFSQFCDHDDKGVAAITVTLDNEVLLKALAQQRRLRSAIKNELGEESEKLFGRYDESQAYMVPDPDKPAYQFWAQKFLGVLLDLPYLHNELKIQQEIIAVEQKRTFHASRVFCSFETESSQRTALTYLQCGYLQGFSNKSATIPLEHRFRQQNILNVCESAEPTAVDFLKLSVPISRLILERLLTFFLTCCVIAAGFVLVTLSNEHVSFVFAGVMISVFNVIIPVLLKIVTSFESHATKGGMQTSLFTKIVICRWVNSAIVIFAITPFTETLTETLVDQLYVIFFADFLTTPLMRFLDIGGVLNRFVFAKKAQTQGKMDSYFNGTAYNIAERYTDITKTLFLAFFYAAIFPAAYIFCLASLATTFFVDKYALLRVWRQQGKIGESISKVSRFFLVVALCAHVVMSSYWWSGFPFDDLCLEDGEYTYCNQDLLRLHKFPALPLFGDEWMNDEQRTFVQVVAWFSVVVLAITFFFVICRWIYSNCIVELFSRTYKVSGVDQQIDFSAAAEAFGYCPQVDLTADGSSKFPFLACRFETEVENGDAEAEAERAADKLWPFHDNTNTYAFWNLSNDLDGDSANCFGVVKYYM